MGEQSQQLGNAIRFSSGLSGRERELATLMAGRAWTSAYEWYAHARYALDEGIHPAVITQKEGGSGLVDPWMRVGLYVTAVAVLLLAAWLIRLRTHSARLTEEVGLLRREALAREGAA